MNPANFCDDCASKKGLSVAGVQCYTQCGFCGITRACFGPAPEPAQDELWSPRDTDRHLQRVIRERLDAVERKAEIFASRWTRDDLWRLSPAICTAFEDQKSRFEAALGGGVAHDIDKQGLELERAYGVVLAKLRVANKGRLAALMERPDVASAVMQVQTLFPKATVVRTKGQLT